MRRWVCPDCGSGVNAPEKPRKDDVRRYCLACSARTGRLMERTSPALERQRAAGRERSAARSATKRTSARDAHLAKWTVGPYNFEREAKRLWNLPTLKALPGHGTLPKIELRRGGAGRFYTAGRAYYWQRRITMTTGADPYDAVMVLLHELMHVAFGEGEGHSTRFWSMMRSAAKEAFPDVPWTFLNAGTRGWSAQGDLAAQLRAYMESKAG